MGLRPKALYVIPDFSNLQGSSMHLDERKRLLALARAKDLLILEDSAYSAFRYAGEPLPSLMTIDTHGCVIHLGTFSKTIFPGIRLGYLVAPQRVAEKPGSLRLTELLCRAKSFLSVNTPPLKQALVGGILLQDGYCSWRTMRRR